MESIIQKLSRYLARESGLTRVAGNNGEVFTYALTLLAVNISALGAIALLAWLLDTLKATLFICLAFYSLRISTGGRHQPGPVKCWLLTVFILTTLGYLVTILAPRAAHFTNLITALGLVLALFAAITRAPVTIASKKFTMEKRRNLKMAAVAIIIFWATLVLTPASTMITADPLSTLAIITGLVTQSISILSAGSRDQGYNELI